MLRGLNHLTFAVYDLPRALDFYCRVLGAELHAKWDQGAYVTIGNCWVCLSRDDKTHPSSDYSHIAFSIDAEAFEFFSKKLQEEGVEIWKQNNREGDSIYFLDPDGHKLEAHVGNLKTRLKSL